MSTASNSVKQVSVTTAKSLRVGAELLVNGKAVYYSRTSRAMGTTFVQFSNSAQGAKDGTITGYADLATTKIYEVMKQDPSTTAATTVSVVSNKSNATPQVGVNAKAKAVKASAQPVAATPTVSATANVPTAPVATTDPTVNESLICDPSQYNKASDFNANYKTWSDLCKAAGLIVGGDSAKRVMAGAWAKKQGAAPKRAKSVATTVTATNAAPVAPVAKPVAPITQPAKPVAAQPVSVTVLELTVLRNIVNSEYQNSKGEGAIDYPVWSFSVTNEDKQLAGALGSLVKKGLAACTKHDGEDETCLITQAGYDLLMSQRPVAAQPTAKPANVPSAPVAQPVAPTIEYKTAIQPDDLKGIKAIAEGTPIKIEDTSAGHFTGTFLRLTVKNDEFGILYLSVAGVKKFIELADLMRVRVGSVVAQPAKPAAATFEALSGLKPGARITVDGVEREFMSALASASGKFVFVLEGKAPMAKQFNEHTFGIVGSGTELVTVTDAEDIQIDIASDGDEDGSESDDTDEIGSEDGTGDSSEDGAGDGPAGGESDPALDYGDDELGISSHDESDEQDDEDEGNESDAAEQNDTNDSGNATGEVSEPDNNEPDQASPQPQDEPKTTSDDTQQSKPDTDEQADEPAESDEQNEQDSGDDDTEESDDESDADEQDDESDSDDDTDDTDTDDDDTDEQDEPETDDEQDSDDDDTEEPETFKNPQPEPVDYDRIAQMITQAVAAAVEPIKEDIETLATAYDEVNEKIDTMPVSGPQTISVSVNGAPAKPIAGTVHKAFEQLLVHASCRDNVLMVGPAGSGKTTAAQQVAEALELPFSFTAVCAQTSKAELFGYMDANSRYVTTAFRKAYEFGGVFLLDEMDAGNANVLTALNAAIDNGIASFPDAMVAMHPDFVLFAGANTFGSGASRQYVGRNQLDAATLSRFSVVYMDIDEQLERQMSYVDAWTKFVQDVRSQLSGERVVISPRVSKAGGKLLLAGMSPEMVLQCRLLNGLDAGQQARVRSIFAEHESAILSVFN